jgi:hypothetical protein
MFTGALSPFQVTPFFLFVPRQFGRDDDVHVYKILFARVIAIYVPKTVNKSGKKWKKWE